MKKGLEPFIVAGGLGLLGAWLIAGDAAQRKKELERFESVKDSNLTPWQLWNKALEFSKEERRKLQSELEQYKKSLESVVQIHKVAEGLRKCGDLIIDESVAEEIKAPIVEYWITRFLELFGDLNYEFLSLFFSDLKTFEKIERLRSIHPKFSLFITKDNGDCSFCGRRKLEVDYLIAGPNIHICNECVSLCDDIIKESRAKKSKI